MATANHRGNIPKKEGNNTTTKYVYNMNTLPKPPPESVKRAIPIPIPRGWGSLMRSKTYREKTIHEVKKESVANEEIVTVVKSRRSVELKRSSVSEVELVAAKMRSAAELLQVKVLVSDMPVFMQLHAFRCARTTYDSLETFSAKHIAYNIKKEFDKVYGPAWHCIVGSSFGSFVTHSTGGFLYFSMENLCILVFKTKVQKALQYS